MSEFYTLRLSGKTNHPNDFVIQKIEAELNPVNEKGVWHLIKKIQPLEKCYTLKEFLELQPSSIKNIIIPGFIDSHLHMLGYGKMDFEVDLSGFRSASEMINFVNDHIKRNPQLEIFIGRNWDDSKLNTEKNTLALFFEQNIIEKIPVFLKRHCRHAALVNKKMRLKASRPESPALIGDALLNEFLEASEASDFASSEKHFLRAQEKLLAMGIVGVSDMSQDEHSVEVVKSLAKKGLLKIDVAGVFDWGRTPSVENHGPAQYLSDCDSEYLNRKAIYNLYWAKKYLDGSLGSSSALLSEPYADEPQNYGAKYLSDIEVENFSREALQKGFQLSFHALGDGAIDQIILMTEKLKTLLRSKTLKMRSRIEHAQVLRSDQIEYFKNNDFWDFHIQPLHSKSDESFSAKRLGQERLWSQGYRVASLSRNKLSFCLSSDAPIDRADPLLALECAQQHRNSSESLDLLTGLWHSSIYSMLRLGFPLGYLSEGSRVLALSFSASDNKLTFF